MDELRERLTPEWLAEKRRIAQAVIEAHEGRRENACGAEDLFDRTFDPPTVLALLDEIERLWRERETLAAAVRAWKRWNEALGTWEGFELIPPTRKALREALALLEGGGGE